MSGENVEDWGTSLGFGVLAAAGREREGGEGEGGLCGLFCIKVPIFSVIHNYVLRLTFSWTASFFQFLSIFILWIDR